MSLANEELIAQALQLPEKDRADLAALLLESLSADFEDCAEETWDAEIQRRLVELDSGHPKAVSWQQARRLIQSRHIDVGE